MRSFLKKRENSCKNTRDFSSKSKDFSSKPSEKERLREFGTKNKENINYSNKKISFEDFLKNQQENEALISVKNEEIKLLQESLKKLQ